jgi:Sporulation protein YtfJ (Spore_YtfJ)
MARRRASAVFERVARSIGGGRLVYAKPLRVGDRAVIPVSRVRTVAGFGFGEGSDESGGGGGGVLDAQPVGFIDVGPEGARYESIPSPATRLIAAGVVIGLLGSVLGPPAVRRLGRATRPSAKRVARWSSKRGRLPLPRR